LSVEKLHSLAPLRDELLGVERLDERARTLAARFTADPSRRGSKSVFPRFEDNVRVLGQAYRALAGDAHRGEFVTPAGEWLLDNYPLLAAEVDEVRRSLPHGYYRSLPRLASREAAGAARIYALAVELVRHSDSRLDRPQLVRFLDAFQTVAPLTIGELWAWPSMLKLALIENLRRLADELLVARAARRAATGRRSRSSPTARARGRCGSPCARWRARARSPRPTAPARAARTWATTSSGAGAPTSRRTSPGGRRRCAGSAASPSGTSRRSTWARSRS